MKKKTVKAPVKKSKNTAIAKSKTSFAKKVSKKPLVKNTKEKASNQRGQRRLVSIRILSSDIEAMRKKAAKLGIPYQTYINILIHRDATGE